MAAQMLNREIFVHDPSRYSLQNDGVSKVEDTATIQYELETFVCEGEYEQGLDRILSTYLSHLDLSTQPSAWVSGFYGSGKSHLVKILEALWSNRQLPDGRHARDIVRVPSHIQEHLRELSSQAKRAGGLWTASGMLAESGEQSVRVLILGIVYKAAGLSSNYGRARFRLWVRKRGWEEEIEKRILADGYDVEEEFNNYLVSPVIADAVWELSGSKSTDAESAQDRWDVQFNRNDVSIDEMEEALREVLLLQSDSGDRLPLTLIVLDEAQQYIGDSGTRAQAVQEAAERIQSAFESKVLLVATGQAALSTTPNLQKLQGRFSVNVMLSDKDVEKVVREVVLLKKPEARPHVDTVLRQVEGEIDRHLQTTEIGPKSEDKDILVADYPLLPSRNRFWASLLHRLDPTGTSGQLRTQLRVVHGANVHVAEKPVGHVIPGDFIFEQLLGGLQQSGVLPRDVVSMINSQDDGSEDGKLRARLIQLIFLIDRLPTEDFNDIGLKATPENLADLLVVDLKEGSADLRRRIPVLLKDLENTGGLLRASDKSYAIQTGESQKWQSKFQEQRAAVMANQGPLGEIRTRVLDEIVRDQTRSLRRTQGLTKTARDLTRHYGNDAPEISATSSNVVVWIRDEWNSSGKTVLSDAREAGDDSSFIFVFLPQRSATEILGAIADSHAARMTLEMRGSHQDSDEGRQAADYMRNRMKENERRYEALLRDVAAGAKVYQGGGSEVDGITLTDKIQTAFESSLKRLFPKFSVGDQLGWDKVFTRASEGNSDALKAINHHDEELNHPVVREVRKQIPGGTGVNWSAIRTTFGNAPYGWPNDTIDGAVAVLVNSGSVTANRNSKEIRGKDLTRQQLAQTTLVGESETLSRGDLLGARAAFQALYQKQSNDDDVRNGAIKFREDVIALQKQAGGEPPRPVSTPPAYLTDMQHLGGNTLIKAIADNSQQLTRDIQKWQQRVQDIEQRMATWTTVEALAAHAEGLEGYKQIGQSLDAIRDGRQLLDNPNPLVPQQQALGALLREALNLRIEAHDEKLMEGSARLTNSDDWLRIAEDRQKAILRGHRLLPVAAMAMSSDKDLLNALDQQPLSQWDDKIMSLGGRIDAAIGEVARILEPSTVDVTVSGAILKRPIDVKRWVEETQEALMKHVQDGHPVHLK